jgi:signal transduction histidine kinase
VRGERHRAAVWNDSHEKKKKKQPKGVIGVQDKPRILVVDDEPKNAKLLEAHLLPQGYDVVIAAHGQEALTIVAERRIDLILLDVMMPNLDGFEVTKRLRGDERSRLIPIVLITALQDTEDRIKGIEVGCDDFISKPFDKNEVLARVKALLKISYYRSLLDEKERFEQVIDRIEDGIVVVDRHFRVTHLNRRAADLLSIDPRNAPTNLISHLRNGLRVHYEGDVSRDMQVKPLSFDLERPETVTTRSLLLAVRSSAIRDPAEDISEIVLTLRDVTEEREEEYQKQDFLSLISHKLRTPVAVITENASALQEGLLGPFNEEQQQALEAIVEKTHGLRGLIEKLLAFTSIRSQTLDRAMESIALPRYLPTLLDPLVKRVRKKPVTLQIDCAGDPVITTMNRGHFDLIIGNLIDNAIKFNDKDMVTIDVAATRRPNGIAISVTDNGPGIPPEEHEKIFATFYQAEKHFTGNVEGAGLGLALVKHLITAYGGAVQVHSQLGHGTTFTVTFPVSDPLTHT